MGKPCLGPHATKQPYLWIVGDFFPLAVIYVISKGVLQTYSTHSFIFGFSTMSLNVFVILVINALLDLPAASLHFFSLANALPSPVRHLVTPEPPEGRLGLLRFPCDQIVLLAIPQTAGQLGLQPLRFAAGALQCSKINVCIAPDQRT